MRPQPITIAELSLRLSDRAYSVVSALYGAQKVKAGRIMLGDVTGNPGDSLSIIMDPLKKPGCRPGHWKDYSTNEHGDIFDLVAFAKYGGDKREAVKWAREFLGLDHCDPEKLKVELRRIQHKERQQRAKAAAEEARRISAARSLFFFQGVPDIIGTPVDHYLAGRKIDVRALSSTGACRFAADCLRADTGELLPAMLLCITGPDGKMAAVHRTYLEQRNGVWTNVKKADKKGKLKSLKLSLGNVQGGHVSVSKGASDVPLGRAPEGDSVLMAEGYETTCVYALAAPTLRCISTISLDNMAQVVMPRTIKTRYLVKENGMGKQTLDKFNRAVEFHASQCDDVRVIESEEGYSDDNDFLMDKELA